MSTNFIITPKYQILWRRQQEVADSLPVRKVPKIHHIIYIFHSFNDKNVNSVVRNMEVMSAATIKIKFPEETALSET
jgi:hypothetical protein